MNFRLLELLEIRLHRKPEPSPTEAWKVHRKPCLEWTNIRAGCRRHVVGNEDPTDRTPETQRMRANCRWTLEKTGIKNGLIDLRPRDRKIWRLASQGVRLSVIGSRFKLTRQRCGQIRRQIQSQDDIRAFAGEGKCQSSLRRGSYPSYPSAPSSLATHTGEGENVKRRGHCVDNERHVNLFIAGGRV